MQRIAAQPHWNYFLSLESRALTISRYVEFDSKNFDTFSIELAGLLMAASAECDVLLKRRTSEIDSESKAENVNQYFDVVVNGPMPSILEARVLLPRFHLELAPFQQWAKNSPPAWWTANNKVKHERDAHFNRANLGHALNALGGLFLVVLETFSEEAARGLLSPNPEIFEPGPPFRVDTKFYAPHNRVYHLPKAV